MGRMACWLSTSEPPPISPLLLLRNKNKKKNPYPPKNHFIFN